ncbi:MAG TPA: TadE/TadG family type IV pilus assembly protein [Xanthobacteraceae bacterium]|nr:TadE/TadG family type IV pilus assembly protein [Xanthobacteraceae bacterium]
MAEYLRRRARSAFRFRRARDGAAAVEFALVSPFFIATLIAVFEVTIYLFAQQTLQTVAVDVGRLMMTGQSLTQSTFNTTYCPKLQPLFTCGSILVDVQSYADFNSAVTSAPSLPYTPSINAGTPGQVVVVRLIYPWSSVSGLFGFAIKNPSTGQSEMMGVTAIRVEPS